MSLPKKVRFLCLAALLLLGLVFVQVTPVGAASVAPVVVNGNPNCQDLGYAYGFKVDAWDLVTFPVTGAQFPFENALNINGGFNAVLTGGTLADAANAVTITSADGVYLDWSATLGIDVVIVKGSSNANVYTYPSETLADTGLHSPINPKNGQPFAISHVEFCYDYELGVTKDAKGIYDRTITWELVKSVSDDTHTGVAGDSFKSTWTVKATKTVVEDNYRVTGDIVISNPSPVPVNFSVADLIDGSIIATVSCPADSIAAFSSITCPYEATTGIDGTQQENVVTVTSSTPGVGGGSATATIAFTAVVIGDEAVTVSDNRTSGPDGSAVSATTEWNYEETFVCSSDPTDYTNGVDKDEYPNTATAEGDKTDLSATATVTVDCTLAALKVEKTAAGSYDRTIEWTLTKSVDDNAHTGIAGQTAGTSIWTVVATKNDSGPQNYRVVGTITIKNPAAIPQTFSVSDTLDDGTVATVTCPDTGDNTGTVDAGQTVDCDYTAEPDDDSATENTATVSAPGNADQSDTAAVSFTEKLTGAESGTLSDPRFGYAETIDASTTKTFEEAFACPADTSLYTNGIYKFTVTNGASLADPINLSASADVEVTCELACEWLGETAWAAGKRYVTKGNWATYTPYVANTTVTLYAGQTLNAGTVHFSAVVGGKVTITINLNPGFRFSDVAENVAIQGYTASPTTSPSPGLFANKGKATTSPFIIEVPAANFYGVHVNVEREVCKSGAGGLGMEVMDKRIFLPTVRNR